MGVACVKTPTYVDLDVHNNTYLSWRLQFLASCVNKINTYDLEIYFNT